MIETMSQTMRIGIMLGGIACLVSLLLTRLVLWLLPSGAGSTSRTLRATSIRARSRVAVALPDKTPELS